MSDKPQAAEPEQPEPAAGPAVPALKWDMPAGPAQPVPPPAKSGPAVLSVVPPAGSLTVDDVVITTQPTPVDEQVAQRAREAALRSGISLREH
jgi:hypothetical protein